MARRAIFLIIVGVAMVSCLIALIGPSKPLTQVKIVRFAVEQGKPVVFFQVEAAEGRRVAIFNIVRIEVDETECTLFQSPSGCLPRLRICGHQAKGHR
jgi:hypothetical protein